MNYEILNILEPAMPTWPAQEARIKQNHGKLITLAPDPGLLQKSAQTDVEVINIVDYVTKRTINPETSMFFNQAPVVDGAEIFMNADGSIDVIKDGNKIGAVYNYYNSRRLVNNVTYYNRDGSLDFLEEYAYDGKLFSRIFYADNEVQQIVFYNDDESPVLTYYFYEHEMNLITVEDPKTHLIIEDYDNTADFLATKVAEITNAKDQVGIIYMGIELTVLSQTKSDNTLYLVEDPLDENGQVRGNLAEILNNQLPYVQHVVVNQAQAEELKESGAPTDKLVAE